MTNVRTLKSHHEFEALDALYHQVFGSSSTPSTTLNNRWEAYPNGLIGLFKNETLIGGLSIWPLTVQTYDQLEQGLIKEAGISTDGIDTSLKNRFYLSEIAIQKSEQGRNHLPVFLAGFLDHLLAHCNLPTSVLALGFSNKGINLLHKLGFNRVLTAAQTADNMPLLRLIVHDKTFIFAKICELKEKGSNIE